MKNKKGTKVVSFQSSTDKHLGAGVFNLLRQSMLTQLPVLRPIAYKIGSSSTNITIDDSVEEDMVEFAASMASLYFVTDLQNELVQISVSTDRVLTAGQLETQGVRLLRSENSGLDTATLEQSKNKELLHTTGVTTVTVYFRQASGYYNRLENQDFLLSKNVDVNGLSIHSSNHNAFDTVAVSEAEQTSLNQETYTIKVVPIYTRDAEDLINVAFNKIADAIEQARSSVTKS